MPKNPYHTIWCRDQKNRMLHRIIMENYLGRELDKFEIVHHCNGDTRDNRIENLELILWAEHTSLNKQNQPTKGTPISKHGTQNRYQKWKCRCAECRKWKKDKNRRRYK